MSLLVFVLLPGRDVFGARVRVMWNPSSVRQGAVAPVWVESPVRLHRIEAVTGSERFPLVPGPGGDYVALIGVDLEFVGETLPVSFHLWPVPGGEPLTITADLKVGKGQFRSQSLSLPAGMVDLTEERQRRVRGDTGMIRQALSERTRERYWSSGFIMPLEGRLSTLFGMFRLLNGKPRSPHKGIDIAAPDGTPVTVSNAGVVTMVGDLFLSGLTVVVDHGWGISTIYAHLSSVSVREGQLIRRGARLGAVGSTGRATGPHLHFGAFIRGANVDPGLLIKATAGF